MNEKVTVDSEDLRSPFPSFTGNFIVSGTPKSIKTERGWMYTFSVYWQNYSKEGYTGANYKKCIIFTNTEEELRNLQQTLHGKTSDGPAARIHIKDGIPKQRKYTNKNGVEVMEEEVIVRAFYPYHLNKQLQKWEKTASTSVESGAQSYGSPAQSGEKLF